MGKVIYEALIGVTRLGFFELTVLVVIALFGLQAAEVVLVFFNSSMALFYKNKVISQPKNDKTVWINYKYPLLL